MPPTKKKIKVKVRKTWSLHPATKILSSKKKRPHRKRKHKGRPEE